MNYFKNINVILLILVLLPLSGIVKAQTYNFKNFSVKEGLSQSEIYAICEDHNGNLWFGTLGGGIVKFDGYDFKAYKEDEGLINNFVRTIYKDQIGRLWIGTEKGVCIYNGKQFKIFNKKLSGKVVKTILQDHSGNFWFGTETSGLYKFNGENLINYNNKNSAFDNHIYSIFEDKNNNLWIGTSKGAYKHNESKTSLFTEESGLASDIIRSICSDDNGFIWFGTQGGGISVFDGEEFINYDIQDGISSNIVYHIYNDNSGSLWFSTAGGITRYRNDKFKIYNESNGLAGNVVLTSYKDKSGNMWFGTSGGGFSKLDSERFTHLKENNFFGRRVFCISQVPGGNMLFGTSKGGITIFDGKTFTLLKGGDNFTDSKVRALYYTKDSTLWIGTLNDGAFKFNKSGFKQYTRETGLCSNNITGFAEDRKGRIWAASSDFGLSILYNDTIINIDRSSGLKSNTIYTLIEDEKGFMWAGTENGGVSCFKEDENDSLNFDIQTFSSDSGLSNQTIRSILKDKFGNLYFGTAGSGIDIFDGSNFRNINRENGLTSDNIYLLIFDDEGNLWSGSETGLDKINFNNDLTIESVIHYGYDEGFTGVELYKNSCFKDEKGHFWFGTISGATKYDASKDSLEKCSSRTYITGIKLFYDNIEDTEYVDSLKAWYPVPEKLELPYNKNSLTFEYVGIYHRNPNAVRYKAMLEGYENKWSPELSKRELTYSNLPPGNYTFKVISCNELGNWNENAAEFSFKILTPVWQRAWFKYSGIFLIILIVFSFVMARIKRIKVRNNIVQERLKMEKSIIELEQKASRLQMNPHFIFNSLNSIQGFIAVNDAFQAKKYLAKFARLMRLTLENSKEEFIPLSNELYVLENYLDLEKLSSNNKFEFEIFVENGIDPDLLEIPPMLLQPFVENAVLHGVRQIRAKGIISIKFKEANNFLICEITDNGIGREESSKIKIKRNHVSSGISITKKRLEQISFEDGRKGRIVFNDLKDENNIPAGTRVIVEIPVIL